MPRHGRRDVSWFLQVGPTGKLLDQFVVALGTVELERTPIDPPQILAHVGLCHAFASFIFVLWLGES